MITYKEVLTPNRDVKELRVFSEGQRVGTIKRLRRLGMPLSWRYIPKAGIKFAGPMMESVAAVKKSLEGE